MPPAKHKDIVKPSTVKIFDLDNFQKLLNGIKVATCMITESHNIVDEASVIRRLNALTINGPSDGNACSCCGVGPFETRAEQTAHYKQHWHTHNLKRKLFGKAPLSIGEFNLRLEDDFSVSGTDSESEDDPRKPPTDLFAAATRHCKAFFTNKLGQVFCVYRCILHHKKEELSTDGDGQAWIERISRLTIPGYLRWAVLMVSGGNFAGAIFSGATPVVHKTHRSYVTRRGQGQSQSTRDQHGNAPRSAGASLRRMCQMQFIQQVQQIISGWEEDLLGCTFILYRAVGTMNQAALFGKNSPLKKDDPRIRVLPFPTKRPSYKETQRVHETVASIEVYETMELFQRALIASSGKTGTDEPKKQQKSPTKLDRAKSRERAPRELPTQMLSSEDEGPCYIDSETPADWIKTLSEQSSNGVITNSRRDLLNDCSVASSEASDSEDEVQAGKRQQVVKLKKKKSSESKKGASQKIPNSVKKMWKAISGAQVTSLDTIFENLDCEMLQTACNYPDPSDGNTALHKAALAEKPDMVTEILTAGGDPCIRNHQLQTPYAASPHADTRVAFRLFQGQYPDKYNYSKSQIPGPLTPELLELEKEKKLQNKRAKRQREKEKMAEKAKTNKYLQLSDAEKIAAVGEKRCFLCGSALPKKPFEYDKYKFCGIKCLQNHRNLRPLNMST
ncbi:hypothetical protein ACJJTC_004852 [Scirpophaga incertulas]